MFIFVFHVKQAPIQLPKSGVYVTHILSTFDQVVPQKISNVEPAVRKVELGICEHPAARFTCLLSGVGVGSSGNGFRVLKLRFLIRTLKVRVDFLIKKGR